MATTVRRRPIRQPPKLTKAAEPLNADELASALATKLTLTSTKGKTKADDGESKVQAMRSVNEASQALSGVVQSGWKKSSGDSSRVTLTTVNTAASRAAKGLAVLRKLRSDDLDVERAAGSVSGKLITLEMYDLAAVALKEMQPRICSLLRASEEPNNLLSLAQPSPPPSDPVILNLASTYLLYAIIIKTQGQDTIDDLANILISPSTRSLLSWLPFLTPLPSKHTDSLLTRTYSVLTKFCTSSTSSATKSKSTSRPESLFLLRSYAMRCLVHTSPGTVEASTFWDQVTRFGASFAKATPPKGEEQATSMIMHAYSELIRLAEQRSDRDQFLGVNEEGKGFLAFCEHWTAFAKRAGDISVLQKINSFMQQPSSSSSSSSLSTTPSTSSPSTTSGPAASRTPQQVAILEGSKIYNVFSQTVLLLEDHVNAGNGLQGSIDSTLHYLRESSALPTLLKEPPRSPAATRRPREEEELFRISGKVDRALEKLRRQCLKFIEANLVSSSSSSSACALDDALRRLLAEIVKLLHDILASSSDLTASMCQDFLTRSIDTLFVLSRTKLNVTNPQTFVSAFEHLKLATTILSTVPLSRFPSDSPDESVDIANYTRCISGAFYNLAGSLYQAMRYGSVVPFLVESCQLGAKALRLPRQRPEQVNEAREKEWKQLEEQLFRRWELLGVCYSKNGDRKNAYDAFKQAIHGFPFASSGLPAQCDTQAPDAIFGDSAAQNIKNLVALVDRVSYIGACELLLPPEEVSLLSAVICSPSQRAAAATSLGPSPSLRLDPGVAGALLERQLDGLEPSRWKEGVRDIYVKLLKDALHVYKIDAGHTDPSPSSECMPIRRARVLTKCMEFAYRDQNGAEDVCAALGLGNVEDIADEVESLASKEALGRDAQLAHFIPQYRVSAHIWVALLAHRRVDPEQHNIMAQRTERACQIIRELLNLGTGTKLDTTSSASKSALAKKSSTPKALKKVAASSPKTKAVSPKRTRTLRAQRGAAQPQPPAAPRKAAPTRGVKTTKTTKAATTAGGKAPLDPVTPKPRARGVLQPVSMNVSQTPPRRSLDNTSRTPVALVFDNFDKFLSLLQLSARLLGLLSLILPKAHLLDATRKLAQRHAGPTSDGFILASLDLAYQYVALGKLKRAISIFNPALEIVRSGQASEEVAVRLLLRFAEYLAVTEDVQKSSNVYLEALQMADRLDLEQKGQSTQQRIHARTRVLELAAMASHVFSLIQHAKGNITASLEGSLQSLRLWNRAVEALTRLSSPPKSQAESDPFDTTSLKEALPSTGTDPSSKELRNDKTAFDRRPFTDGLEWRVTEGLLSTMFALAQAYFLRGSAREAEYFAKQAADLAEQLNAPGMVSRALARQGEVQLHMGLLEDAQANLLKAAEVLGDVHGLEAVDARRLKAEAEARKSEEQDVQQMFDETVTMLEGLDAAFRQFDAVAFGPRKSLGASPGRKEGIDVLAPDTLVALLSRRLWLLRDDVGPVFNATLERILSLSSSTQSKAEEYALLGRLTLHGVYGRFRSDMFLSSLTESTIAVPLGMSGKDQIRLSLSTNEVMDALADAEEHYWNHLSMTVMTGNVMRIREAATMLVLIGAFRTSLGDRRSGVPSVMAGLLDCSAALTLRRDMLDAILHKLPSQCFDDLQWPRLTPDGAPMPRLPKLKPNHFRLSPTAESDDEDDVLDASESVLRQYWEGVRDKYQSQTLSPSALSACSTIGLPSTWSIVNIAVTPDKSTLFISKQQGGDARTPLIFCIPLKGRRDHGGTEDDESHLTFDGAIQELKDIVHASDQCTKAAVNIRADDDEARSNWWKERGQLDVRMRELLENIEYCWLGAFKTILNRRPELSPDGISDLRAQFEKIFHRALHVKDKKPKSKSASSHKKSLSTQLPTSSPNQFVLDDSIVECFSTLSPKCRDEELEDLVYFVLDLYQFHGVPVAIAEVDIDQVVVDLRNVLEEHSVRFAKEHKSRSASQAAEEHMFLILDKNVQGLPWESMPILRGRSVSRIPGVQFLHDRIAYARLKQQSSGRTYDPRDGSIVDPKKGFFILNPSGDLNRTEERFRDWAKDMKAAGWDGVIGKSLTEQQFVNALKTQDLVVYFGHGGGEQYIRSHRIRSLPTCAATMLWGCSSGALRDMGDFDRTGTPYNYMLAGCPTLVANLWDVTDKDIDKISLAVFDKLGLSGKSLATPMENKTRKAVSLVAAVAQSRDSCKLKYLTGAAPVVYGIPFYI